MPDVTLRDYLDQLDTLLTREAYDEVITHCHHILQHFPKNLDTYRLLGSALLRSRNHRDAGEVFERLLSAEPADFQAHRGLSEVYEIDKDVNAAIWHMERAFDAAPQNTQVITELKRLYEKRDGERPEKIQMTRAALARQYMNAQLYDQAVAELGTAVENSPERYDLRVLLAEAFYTANYLRDAGDIALDILDDLPECLPAHILMARLWLSIKRPDDAKPFLAHVEDLSPYTSLELITESGIAPASAFTLPKLDYEAAAAARLSSTMPSWMNDLAMDMPTTFSATGSSRGNKPKVATINEELPDWMSDVADPSAETAAPEWFPGRSGLDTPAPTPTGPLGSVEDWFKDMAAATPAAEEAAPDWFQDIPVAETPKERSAPTGLTGFLNEIRQEEAAPAGGLDLPDMDWMSDIGSSASSVSGDDDLSFLGDPFEQAADDMPDFLLELEDSPTGTSPLNEMPEQPMSLTQLFGGSDASQFEVDDSPIEERRTSLTGLFGSDAEAVSEVDDSPIQERRPSLTTLFGGSDELTPADTVTTDTQPGVNPRSTSEMAAMIAFFDQDEAQSPASAEMGWLPAAPGEEVEPAEGVNLSWLQAPTEEMQAEDAEATELPAWLAAPQEAAEPSAEDDFDSIFGAELAQTTPEGISEEDTPSWLSGATETADEPAELPDWMNNQSAVENNESDTPDWMGSQSAVAENSPSVLEEDDFDSLFGAELAQATPETVEEEDTPSWLSGTTEIADEPAAAELPDWMSGAATLESAETEAPDWLTGEDTESDWMSGTSEEAQPAAAELPDWMSGAATTVESTEAETPDWLSGEDTESDWLTGTSEEAQPAATELPDWMSGAATVESTEASTPDWLSGDTESDWLTGTNEEAQPAAAELPDWMSGAATVESTEASTPDWLSGDTESDWLTGTNEEAQPAAAELPDWMSGAATVESTEASTPDWLSSETDTESDWLSGTSEEAQPAAAELPDWMSGAATVESTEASTPDWLSSNADTESDWLSGTSEEAQPAAAELPDWMSSAATVENAEASTPDWLSSETDIESDWLTGTSEEAQPAAAELPDWMSGAATFESTEASTPDWLSSETDTESDWLSGTSEEAQPAAAELPDWMSGAATVESTEASTPDWLSSETDNESDWLSGTSEEAQPAAAELPDWMSGAATVESTDASTPDWLSSETDNESDWLSGTSEEAQPAAAELPDWMSGAATVESTDASTPDWLSVDADTESDWLSGAEEGTAEASTSDWLAGTPDLETFEMSGTASSDPDWLSAAAELEESAPAAAQEDWFAGIGQAQASPAVEPASPIEVEPAFASWMSAFSEDETTEEAAAPTEVDNFLADFVDPDAARIGAQRPMVAQDVKMVDNMEESESTDDAGELSFDFDFDFEKPPAWMRKAGGEDKSPSFKPKWMRDQGE